MKYSIGVDIGGTKVAVAIVNETGVVVKQNIIPTDTTIFPEQMIQSIIKEIQIVIAQAEVPHEAILGIGIGSPGPLDSKNGVIICPPNLPSWRDVPIKESVEEELSYPVRLENDANAATLAEKWLGAGRQCDHVIYMTVSTGIGVGIITDGKLLHGQNGNAGDIGHMVMDPSFGRCTCGQWGCLEAIASGTAIAKQGSKLVGRTISSEHVFQLYYQNDPKIVTYIDRVFQFLGAACVTLVNTFDTEIIVMGGGVSKVGQPLFTAVQKYVSTYALNPKGRKTKIVPAELEQNAGVIGAASLWFETT
ncbi:ROK family protein [Lentibacillus daqui]|uniref:ROK family protein n=1 Tax=Lentibacillus daqui TaxID=2911514 RepID=UPI0022B1BD23|nr:ROK family protein [Lentibacillus daqui]